MLASPQLRAFNDIRIRFVSGAGRDAAAASGIDVTARLRCDQRGSFVEFVGHFSERDEAPAPFQEQFYLQRCQIFRIGPSTQLWIVNTVEDEANEAVYPRTFTAEFKSEESSDTFFDAIHSPNKGFFLSFETEVITEDDVSVAAMKLPNGSTEVAKDSSKFDKKIEASSAKMYFHYYGQLLHQQNMLQDYVRTGTYYAAVVENRADFQGRVVVDVGAGSGILSLFAAQAGAKHVYAVEASSMADYARKLIAGNHVLSQRITVIHGKVEDVELPEKADVLISEPMGTLLVNERMLESYIIARDRFLVPGGKMFPGLGRIHMAPFSDEYLFVEIANKALFWQQQSYYGVDLTPLHNAAFQGYFSQPVVDAFDPRLLVAPPAMHSLDLTSMKEEDLYDIVIPLTFTATMAARVHGIACWFDVLFNGSTIPRWLTTAPGAPTTHWYQLRLVLSQPLYVMAGQTITTRLHLSAHSAQSYTINLSMSTTSWGAGAGQGATIQSSSGKFDLKEPYYRMSQMPAYTWTQEQQLQDGAGVSLQGAQMSPYGA
ncbi:hypothetical protein SELMODRAFT_149478 [Selaginella moellendorffii]|uniref:type I protein arginine methyltransferase n=1 Tax=Selaginella moellendorffii TaxID=88036 RepID=D8RSE2_SELML|nr:hypothetical protein SELMODRAFT_149478 [Selaginella moellendorffii]